MYSVKQYVFPRSLAEAYNLLQENPANTIVGGAAYLRLSHKSIHTAIDISRLDLSFIRENEEYIEIGAMTTLREIETGSLPQKYFSGVLSQSVRNIAGVQLRNLATVGGTVYSRYGFSDLNTALLALDVDVVLFHAGRMPLEKFMAEGALRDILVKLMIRKSGRIASFQAMRNSHGDYAILNAAVSRADDDWKIVVGARPGRGERGEKAAKFLSQSRLTSEEIAAAARMAVEELTFGSNIRGSKEYRQAVGQVLVRRCLQDVAKMASENISLPPPFNS